MRYRLRTLLIVLALGPPVLAAGYWLWQQRNREVEERLVDEMLEELAKLSEKQPPPVQPATQK